MEHFVYNSLMSWKTEEDRARAICGYMQFHVPFIVLSKINTAIYITEGHEGVKWEL